MSKTRKKDRVCTRCGKPCYGKVCRDCFCAEKGKNPSKMRGKLRVYERRKMRRRNESVG